MSMLVRYRKPGGFLQLVSLIETCIPEKQERLLELLESESLVWSEAVQEKMLTFERIMSWAPSVIHKVIEQIDPKTFGVAVHGPNQAVWDCESQKLTKSARRRINSVAELAEPYEKENQIATAHVLEDVREMLQNGTLDPLEIDLTLIINGEIEKTLDKMHSERFSENLGSEEEEEEEAPPPVEAKPSILEEEIPIETFEEEGEDEGVTEEEFYLLMRELVVLRMINAELEREVESLRIMTRKRANAA